MKDLEKEGSYLSLNSMANQSKKKSILESVVSTTTGLIVSFLIQLLIYPLLDINVSTGKNIVITLIFFVTSVARGFIIRRLFNKI